MKTTSFRENWSAMSSVDNWPNHDCHTGDPGDLERPPSAGHALALRRSAFSERHSMRQIAGAIRRRQRRKMQFWRHTR